MCPRRVELAVIVLLLPLLLPASGLAASNAWSVVVGERDLTFAAAPREQGAYLTVDLGALAPLLGLRLEVGRERFEIIDSSGLTWQGAAGQPWLETAGQRLALSFAPVREGSSIRLPLPTVARLAGLSLAVDRQAQVMRLVDPATTAASPDLVAGGWRPLALPKPPEARRDDESAWREPSFSPILPPEEDVFHLSTSLGWAQDGGMGSEISGWGSVAGYEAQLAAVGAWGADSFDLISGLASLRDRAAGWSIDGGHLYSEAAGSVEGLRLAVDRWPRHRPLLALYRRRGGDSSGDTLAVVGDQMILGRALAGWELASDGSWLSRAGWQGGSYTLHGFLHDPGAGAAPGGGVSAAWAPLSRVALQGGWSRTDRDGEWEDWRTLSLRLPLPRRLDLTLGSTWGPSGRQDVARIDLPAGPLRLGLQGRRRQLPGQAQADEDLSLTVLLPGAGRFGGLAELGWDGGAGGGHAARQLALRWQLSDQTSAELWAGDAGGIDGDGLRLRLLHRVAPGLELELELGRVTPFQSAAVGFGEDVEDSRVRFLVRKRWHLKTPIRGGSVAGRVQDSLGDPVAGAVVGLGDWRVATDGEGRYRFPRVPAGEYPLAIDAQGLPVGWAVAGAVETVEVKRRAAAEADLTAVPLQALRGLVFLDRNGDGLPGADEGVGGVAFFLDEEVTASDATGAFSFHLLPPGRHTLRLDASRLPPEMVLAGQPVLEVEIAAGSDREDVVVGLLPRQREIHFGRLPDEPSPASRHPESPTDRPTVAYVPPTTAREATPVEERRALPGPAWGVQVAALKNPAFVPATRLRLQRELGLPVEVVEVDLAGSGTWYRVIVGSVGTEGAAYELRRRLGASLPEVGPVRSVRAGQGDVGRDQEPASSVGGA